jgi:hypothetical protein
MGRAHWAFHYDQPTGKSNDPNDYQQPFTVMQPGNEFFIDYQPGNNSVFSFFDNLGIDTVGITQPPAQDAVLSYLIVGYHSWPAHDPLCVIDLRLLSNPLRNKDLMEALGLSLDPAQAFMSTDASKEGRSICHGVIRNIKFDRKKTELETPSVTLQNLIYEAQPIAVGSHALDALSAYLHVELVNDKAAQDVHRVLDQLVTLIVRNDDVDHQRKAVDEVASNDWNATPEGTLWKFPDQNDSNTPAGGSPSPNISPDHVKRLKELNAKQSALDTCVREYLQLLQSLYGCWWNAIRLRAYPDEFHESRRETIKAATATITTRITTLRSQIVTMQLDLPKERASLQKDIKLNKNLVASSPRGFGIHLDPTVLFAGAPSGWPVGFSDPLPVRIASQIGPERNYDEWDKAIAKRANPSNPHPGLSWWNTTRLQEVASEIAMPLMTILREFVEDDSAKVTWPESPYKSMEDASGKQGWFPLYVEWEVEYYHIPWDYWEFLPNEETGRWRYEIKKGVNLPETKAGADCRKLSGRAGLTPQSSLTLRTRLEQLFDQRGKGMVDPSNPQEPRFVLDDVTKKKILAEVAALEYFSAPLSGLTDHLLTLRRGHHPQPIADDEKILAALGTTKEYLELIKSSHDFAPYGATTLLDPGYTSFSPFKPVTHGQVRFTKLVIVDKFGQIVVGIKPAGLDNQEHPSALYPCVSPTFACEALPEASAKYFPNTAVKADEDHGVCQFFQIPPRINQKARLNANFVMPTTGATTPSVAGEWDNPIWGWLLANYQDDSIQVFDPDGLFVTEMLIIRTNDTVMVGNRLGKMKTHTPSGRLADFIEAMKDFAFTHNLYKMLAESADSLISTSADFDSTLSAAFGRPFCLADVGVSIELATPPLQDTSLLTSPVRMPEPELGDYEFSVALGNHTAAFDGLVGTFDYSGPITKIMTGYGLGEQIAGDNGSHTLQPRTVPLKVKPYFKPGDLTDLSKEHAKELQCVSCILDPVVPLHVYTGSLFPVLEVPFPRWATTAAMAKLQAFFTSGPFLCPEMPPADEVRIQVVDESKRPTVQMPLGVLGTSNTVQWLSPRKDGADTEWDGIAVRPVDEKLKVESAELTEVVEGFVTVQKVALKP